ncbi:hypothetical protein PV326_001750, partial [Microctonus aethiopoides]
EISAIRNVSYYEAKKIIDDKQDSHENPWVKPSNHRMDNRARIERRGTMIQQKETKNNMTYPTQTTSKSIQQRLNNSERTKSNREEDKGPQNRLVLNNIIEQWDDIKTEEWSEDELAKYFNEIAAYAMRRTMAIKRRHLVEIGSQTSSDTSVEINIIYPPTSSDNFKEYFTAAQELYNTIQFKTSSPSPHHQDQHHQKLLNTQTYTN